MEQGVLWRICVSGEDRCIFRRQAVHGRRKCKNVMKSLLEAMDAHRVLKRRGFHMFLKKIPTDGGEVVSLKYRPPLNPRNIAGSHFYQNLSRSQGHSAVLRIRSFKSSVVPSMFKVSSMSQINPLHNLTSCL
jgi:hypothetical protein